MFGKCGAQLCRETPAYAVNCDERSAGCGGGYSAFTGNEKKRRRRARHAPHAAQLASGPLAHLIACVFIDIAWPEPSERKQCDAQVRVGLAEHKLHRHPSARRSRLVNMTRSRHVLAFIDLTSFERAAPLCTLLTAGNPARDHKSLFVSVNNFHRKREEPNQYEFERSRAHEHATVRARLSQTRTAN